VSERLLVSNSGSTYNQKGKSAMRILTGSNALTGCFFAALIIVNPCFALQPEVPVQTIQEVRPSDGIPVLTAVSSLQTTRNLWVDAVNGNDANDGLTAATAFRTIQYAADLASAGTTVHIQPGVYRESIIPAQSGSASATIRYVAEGGPGTAVLRGSDPASSLAWNQLSSNTIGLPAGVDPTKIYYADLSAWGLSGPPRFVVELDGQGNVSARLPLAREPDWTVATDWKYHEYWWAADGGSTVASCDPPTNADPMNCDAPSRSLTQLTDRTSDGEPAGIEPGNLTTLGDLTGATLIAKDAVTGTFTCRRTIVAHDVSAGRITLDQNCEDGSGSGKPALGWGSKYYVQGLPDLLDTPGEWWYDQNTSRLYLWPRTSGNPASQKIEISRRSDGFTLTNRSYITLDGLTLEFFERNAIYVFNDSYDKSQNDAIRNAILRYTDNGVWLRQYVDPAAPINTSINGFLIEDSEISFMDSKAFNIYYSWKGNTTAASFLRPGVLNTVIRRNKMHHLGFNADSEGVGGVVIFADHFKFEDNYIHDVAHNGIQFMRSVVQSSKTYGFSPNEIKTGDILIRNNIFEKACENAIDCGGLKISGSPPDRQVFRDLLVTGNIFRNTFGWTYIGEKRGHFDGPPGSVVQGMGGFGFYVDNASGINAYRNIAYNNAFTGFKLSGVWRDGDIFYYNNTIANSLFGFHFGGKQYDTHNGSVNTQLVNNIIVNNETHAIFLSDANGIFENTTIDHNLYYDNGWRPYSQGGEYYAGNVRLDVPGSEVFYLTLADIQTGTSWEDHGVEGSPAFQTYNVNDHNLYDGSWPDLHLTTASTNAIDRGASALPASLTALLNHFGLYDAPCGTAYDIGRYEACIQLPFSTWAGGAVVTADQNVVAVGRPHIGSEVASYDGFSSGSTTMYVPMLFKQMWGTYDSALYIQNTDTANSAAVTIKFYDPDGTLNCTKTDTIPKLSSHGYWLPSETCLPDSWYGGVVVTADRDIVAVGRPHIGNQVMTYNGFSSGSTTMYVPMLFKQMWESYDSAFYVQNTDAVNSANVTIKFYDPNGVLNCTKPDTIPAMSSHGYWLPSETCLPDSWYGGVVVTSDRNIVAVGRPHIGSEITTYNGFAAGSTTLYAPMLFKRINGTDDSALYIQNVNPVNTATISIKFYDQSGVLTYTQPDTISPGSSKGYWLPSIAGLPASWQGSVKVESDQPVVGIARPHLGSSISAYDGFSSGSTTMYVPMLFKQMWGSYDSALYMENISATTTANVTVKFYDVDGNLSCVRTETIPALGVLSYWLPDLNCSP
jgi:hypothetical protein